MNLKREDFKKIMSILKEEISLSDKLYDLGIDIINCESSYSASRIVDILMPLVENDTITDCINAYLFEDRIIFSDNDGNKYIIRSDDEFYNFLCKL